MYVLVLIVLPCSYHSGELNDVLLPFFLPRPNKDRKHSLHVYCLLDIVIIFSSRHGESFCHISNYTTVQCLPTYIGMRKGIQRCVFGSFKRKGKIHLFEPWNVFAYWFFFHFLQFYFHYNNEISMLYFMHKQHTSSLCCH